MSNNRVCNLFGIQYPIIQGGMVWTSGWKLASAVSNAGGLGLIGSGSMNPELLREHIQKCRKNTKFPFGVNIPLIYSHVEEHVNTVIEEKVPIVFTSAGNPKTWTGIFHQKNIKVAHVTSSRKFALKAQEAGVVAIVAEGFEAGGHNGREENTSLTLIPSVKPYISCPLIAAGGIATGKGMFAAMALGAEGVQIGSRFVASTEASCHELFKKKVIEATEGDTVLTLKEDSPVRLLKNQFYEGLLELYKNHSSQEELKAYLKKGNSREAMFLGNVEHGKLEIGQIVSIINEIKPVKEIITEILADFRETQSYCSKIEL